MPADPAQPGPVEPAAARAADIAAFAHQEKKGGWATALPVARWVELDAGHGVGYEQTSKKGFDRILSHRISAKEFAHDSGSANKRIKALYEAWERGAALGHVVPAASIKPGQEVKLPDEAEVPFFGEGGVYHSYETRHIAEPRLKKITEYARANGVSATVLCNMVNQPKALTALVLADDESREVIEKAVAEHKRRQDRSDVRDRQAAAAVTAARTEAADARLDDEQDDPELTDAVRRAVRGPQSPEVALSVFDELATVRLGVARALAKLQANEIPFARDRVANILELVDSAVGDLGAIRDLLAGGGTGLTDEVLAAFIDENRKRM